MPNGTPDYHDADIVLRLYELRRDKVMRESRESMNRDFWPRSLEDVLAVTNREHPLNAAYRQVSTYWEMAFGFARHGIAHAELLAENSSEGILLYTKIFPYLEELRAKIAPALFQNAQWIVENTQAGKERFTLMQNRVGQALPKR